MGLVWMTESDVTSLATKANPMSGYILNLRLSQPGQAAALVSLYSSNANNAPLLTDPGAALAGSPGAPAITAGMVAGVVGVALVVALASTLVPAIRAARSSTISALNDSARPVRRHGRLISLSSRLPIAALFGLRLAARRPRRTLLSAAGIAVTVCGFVAMLTFHAAVDAELHGTTTAGAGLANPVVSRDGQMLVVITVVLAILAAITAIFTAWATVLDARRASALMRALGATSRQVSAGLAWAQVLAALPGAIIGIPLGTGLFDVLSRGATGFPQTQWLVLTFTGTLLVVAGLTTIPARIAARVPPPQVLQAGAD